MLQRRRLIQGSGAFGLLALAGCAGMGGGIQIGRAHV